MHIFPRLLLVVVTVGLIGCDTGPKGSVGFTLPDGDVERGKANYIEFQCNACHQTDVVPQQGAAETAAISVRLGGETTRIKTYGELVTSVINPSHRVARRNATGMANESGESLMISYNDVMTVTQLIDLVAFVQSNYKLSPYKHSHYPVYWIPEAAEKAAETPK